MLAYYGLEEKYVLFKEWYEGYHFGNVDVYCPWDVINQCDKFCESRNAPMEPYWENSSSNFIVRDILENSSETTKSEIEALISGDTIQKMLIPELTYTDLDNKETRIRQTYLWSVLFATGYLTDAEEPKGKIHRLAIPNQEVLGIYKEHILSWFQTNVTQNAADWTRFCRAFIDGDSPTVQTVFNEFMSDSISIRDTCVHKEMKENFYHGLLLGLLKANGHWSVKSNAESGTGCTDIKLTVPQEKAGCIIEVKYAENGIFDSACQKTLKQIDHDGYVSACKQEGMETIYKFGIACYKKKCKIVCVPEI